jgi:hypothetical protein
MRKLPLLFVLLLASLTLAAAAASAHAPALPTPAQAPFASDDDEIEIDDEEGEDEDEGDGSDLDDEGEECEASDDDACEEDLDAEWAEDCVLADADASFTAAPGAGEVRLRVRYRAFEPSAVVVDARLRGARGALHLGTRRTRFGRAGVYRYSFDLGDKQMAKAVAAKDFEVSLYAVGTPADCELQLATRARHRAR